VAEEPRPRIDVSPRRQRDRRDRLRSQVSGGTSGVLIFGGGSPKNFMLQTEPQIQEVLGLAEAGHDYFVQVTDARPTPAASRATPGEAVSWGKVDPRKLPGTSSSTATRRSWRRSSRRTRSRGSAPRRCGGCTTGGSDARRCGLISSPRAGRS
jgi:hypothetical protein